MRLHVFGPGFSTLARSVRLYCEEKGLTHTYGMDIDGIPVSWCSEAHLAQHPFGKVPVLLHGSERVFETIAICRYLDAVFPERLPVLSLAAHTSIGQWSSALATSVDAALVRNFILPLAGPRQITLDAIRWQPPGEELKVPWRS